MKYDYDPRGLVYSATWTQTNLTQNAFPSVKAMPNQYGFPFAEANSVYFNVSCDFPFFCAVFALQVSINNAWETTTITKKGQGSSPTLTGVTVDRVRVMITELEDPTHGTSTHPVSIQILVN